MTTIACCVPLRIENSGRSMICNIAHISETIKGIIKCDISNDWANYSLSFDIDKFLIIIDSRTM